MNTFSPDLEIPIGKRTFKYRFFEILPGFLTWSLLALPVLLSIFDPTSRLAAVFVLFFMMSWFYRAVGMAFRTMQGYNKMKTSEKNDWQGWLSDLNNPEKAIVRLTDSHKTTSKSAKVHLENLHHYVSDSELHNMAPSDLVQLIVMPIWKESYEVVAPTLEAILKSNYDSKKVILVIAHEERGGEEPKQTAHKLIEDYGISFMQTAVIEHPGDLPNEVVGKGGNITWAMRQFVPGLLKQGIEPEHVVVTSLDCDNRPHPDYLAHVAYSYILTKDRKHRSFQPLALYTNNIWDVPAPMRVLAVGNTFFTIMQSVRPHMLRNFSSHAQSLDALLETDYWSVRTVVEDGHHFWRSYFAFKGNHSVVPIYSPIYQDAVLSDRYPETLKAQFVQMRRWAYGASDIPYIANIGFRRKKDRVAPLGDIIMKFFRLLDTHVSWGTVSLLLLLAARIPLFIGPNANKSIVAHQLPIIASYAQTMAMVGLFISIYLSMKLLPPRPAHYKKHRTVFMVLQWALLPITSILYGSLAALNSQTRLMFGRYLDKFDLTHKGVKKKS
ncbi:glycosyltransferase family 2 protein [Candidatus Saccharibacteria bacterium]|nr:glycosyltransferase family 2 protein [Candidatus Saccharibacteria bacterium]